MFARDTNVCVRRTGVWRIRLHILLVLKMFDYEGNQGTIGQKEDNLETSKYEISQLNRRAW